MDTLTTAFGKPAVLGGVCMIPAEIDAEERIVQLAPMQKLVYGELSGEITPRIQAVDAAFSNAGFDTQLSTQILHDMWQKWVYIASIGLITCLLDAPIGEINSVPDGNDTALQCLNECASVAAAMGYPPAQPFLDSVRTQITPKDSKTTSSMFRDMQKGAGVEVEAILGDLLKHAQAHHLKTPFLQAGCVRLRVYQNTRNSS